MVKLRGRSLCDEKGKIRTSIIEFFFKCTRQGYLKLIVTKMLLNPTLEGESRGYIMMSNSIMNGFVLGTPPSHVSITQIPMA